MAKRQSLQVCAVTAEQYMTTQMLRFVLSPTGVVTPDLAEDLPGDAVWLVGYSSVLRRAIDEGIFTGRWPGCVIPPHVETLVGGLLRTRALSSLGMAVKSGALVAGFEKVQEMLRARRAAILFHASDAGADGKSKMALIAGQIPVIELFTRDELSIALGKGHVVHASVAASPVAKLVVQEVTRFHYFMES